MSEKKVLATVEQREVTQSDMDLLVKSMDPKTAAQFSSEQGKNELVKELVNQELFYLDAVNANVEKEEEFRLEFEKVKADFIKQYSINKLLKGIQIGEGETEAFYNTNKEHFKSPESVKASHILVKTEDEADKILDEINSGLHFEEAAKKYSSCPSKEQGGDLGFFTRGQMVPEFEEAAFGMEQNQVSKPVKTQFGYHIIKLYGRKQSGTRSFEEVKDQLSQQLLSRKQQELYYKKIDELKSKYSVKMFI